MLEEIKISQLDPISGLLSTDDYFPIVDSGSFTTFKVSLGEVAQLLTSSLYSSGSLYASQSLFASQSSFATQSVSSSYAVYAVSSSLTSQSISASYALLAGSSISSSYLSGSNSIALSFTSSKLLAGNVEAQNVSASSITASVVLSSTISASSTVTANGGFAYGSANPGQSGNVVVYDAVAANWKYATFNGGILTNSSSVASSPFVTTDTVGIGTIIAYAGTVAPNNWLECDGRVVLTASYSGLYNAIKNNSVGAAYGFLCNQYGVPDPSNFYFKIPDLRGEFIRGWDHNRGVDVGRGTGSFQAESFKTHQHTVPRDARTPSGIDSNGAGSESGGTPDNYGINSGGYSFLTLKNSDGGGNETRPRNLSAMYIIKYTGATSFATSGSTLSGDVIGNITATTVIALDGVPLTQTAPLDKQVLTYDASLQQWGPASPNFAYDTIFPYIQSIEFTSSNDDWVNVVIGEGKNLTRAYDYTTAGFGNNGNYGSRKVTYDTASGLYWAYVNSTASLPLTKSQVLSATANQEAFFWCDNRGGGGNYIYFRGTFVVKVSTSPTTMVTHTYTPLVNTNYAGNTYYINAIRAKHGLNAILNADSMSLTSFTIPQANTASAFTTFVVS